MKKLLIIIGAGASLDFGMPSVRHIDELFEEWAKENFPLLDDPNKSLYTWVKENLRAFASQNSQNRIEAIVNFESLLYTIQSLSAISNDIYWKHCNYKLNPFIDLKEFPKIRSFRTEKVADGNDFHFLQSFLVDKLLDHMRKKCQTLEKDKTKEIKKLRKFFTALKNKFKIGFINLNYDNVILTTLPDLKTGFNDQTGIFDRDSLHNPSWNFCYHIHGSVHFDMKGGDGVEMHKILWNKDLNSQFSQNSSGRSSNYTSEGLQHLNSSIIAGLDKTNQLLRDPFAPYYMKLDQLIHESDAVLFIGYGFSDLHLNSVFPNIRYDKSKKRKVVIIDWASDDEDGLNFRHDGWSFGVFSALPFNGFEMGNGQDTIPRPVIHYKKKSILEKSSNPDLPIALWYNGVMDACKNVNRIIDELK